MREHLYKAKRADTGEWVDGDLITNPETSIRDCILSLIGTPREFIEVLPETVCQFVRFDINGKSIFNKCDVFTFEYLRDLHKDPLKLEGTFDWHEDELRYEIDVIGHEDIICLSYNGNGIMRNFKIKESSVHDKTETT